MFTVSRAGSDRLPLSLRCCSSHSTIKEAMNMYNSRHPRSYKHCSRICTAPSKARSIISAFFYNMAIMAVSATVSGAASLWPHRRHQLLCRYRRRRHTILTILVPVLSAGLRRIWALPFWPWSLPSSLVGIHKGGTAEGTMFFTQAMAQDFAVNGFSNCRQPFCTLTYLVSSAPPLRP